MWNRSCLPFQSIRVQSLCLLQGVYLSSDQHLCLFFTPLLSLIIIYVLSPDEYFDSVVCMCNIFVFHMIFKIHLYYMLTCISSLLYSKYPVSRKTSNLNIPYFLRKDYHMESRTELRRIERQVEEEFVSNLRNSCWRERSYSKLNIN